VFGDRSFRAARRADRPALPAQALFYVSWVALRNLYYPYLIYAFYKEWREFSAESGTPWNWCETKCSPTSLCPPQHKHGRQALITRSFHKLAVVSPPHGLLGRPGDPGRRTCRAPAERWHDVALTAPFAQDPGHAVHASSAYGAELPLDAGAGAQTAEGRQAKAAVRDACYTL
jgi:hypothetical protein